MQSSLLNPAIQEFINQHLNKDVVQLALKYKEFGGLPIQIIIQQIQGKQKAKYKLPLWYSTPGVLFPPSLNLEQSSSEATAAFKSSILRGNTFIDLTGGFGVDATFFSNVYEEVVYVERNSELFEIAQHNFDQLSKENIKCVNKNAEEFIQEQIEKVDCIYLDPARRDKDQRKVFRFQDCEPNIVSLKDHLLKKANRILVKASPLLDIKSGINELRNVTEVYVVAVDNDCKEILFLLEKQPSLNPEIIAVNILSKGQQIFKFDFQSETEWKAALSLPLHYLYEPNSAILKGGGFNSIAKAYPLYKLHSNSHLYTGTDWIPNFPGRKFEIVAVQKYDRIAVGKFLTSGKANITVRNFPDSVEKVRKKLQLKDGGEDYLFATTDLNNKPIIIIVKKAE